MKKIYKKEEGVSPVIATILMVAITVVLAATVYIMVAGMGGGGTNKLIANLTYDEQNSNPAAGKAILKVSMSTPPTAAYSKVIIVINGTKASTFSGNTATITLGANTYTIQINDWNGDGKLSDGDTISITGTGTNLLGATVALSITGYSGTAQVTIPTS